MKKMDDKDFIKYEIKWMGIIKPIFDGVLNKNILKIICYYCEWFNSDLEVGNDKFPKELVRLLKTLESFNKIEIVSKFYNRQTDKYEYIDNKYNDSNIKDILDYKLSEDELIKLFELEFLFLLDKSWGREYKLNKLFE